MHPVVFALKRAHLCTTAHAQQLVRSIKHMTPARFDVMCFLRQSGIRLGEAGKNYGMIKQRTMLKGLGLHPSTLSKMLRRLEQLGWITRGRDYEDRRLKVIMITALGLQVAWKAMRTIFRQRLLRKEFEPLCRYLYPTRHVIEGLSHLYDTIDMLADAFGDQAKFYYEVGASELPYALVPWGPPMKVIRHPERLKKGSREWHFRGLASIIDG